VPPQDRFCWYVAAAESAGVVAAAASTTTDDRLRRELITAWKAINRAVPTATSIGVDVAPGDSAQLRVVGAEQRTERPVAVWPEAPTAPAENTAEVSALLGGASRVLMAARLADAPDHVRVQALIVQAIELAAQISRTIAAQQDATAVQRRAAEATRRAVDVENAPARGVAGWQFTKTGADVIESARRDRAGGVEPSVDLPRPTGPEPGADPNEQGR
jgi:hypothetical protein